MENFLKKYLIEIFIVLGILLIICVILFAPRYSEQVNNFKLKCEEAGGVVYTLNSSRGRIDPICMKPDAIVFIDF